MIEVKTQAEFDAVVASTPTDQMVRIYPKTGGGAYTMTGEWTLPGGAHVQGIHHPQIAYTGTVASGATRALLKTATSARRVKVRGLELVGKTVTGTLIGIQSQGSGTSFSSGLDTGTFSRYNSATTGIQATHPGIIIEDCVISLMDYGIELRGSHNFRVSRNRTKDNRKAGVHINGSRSGLVSFNRSFSDDDTGILIDISSSINLNANRAENPGQQGIEGTGNLYLTVRNNKVSGAGVEGISFYNTSFAALNGNSSTAGGDHGIYLNGCSFISTAGNVTTNNSESGIRGNTVSQSTFAGNVTKSNYYGIELTPGSQNLVTGNMARQNTPGAGIYLGTSSSAGVGNHMNGNSTNLTVAGTGSTVPSTHNEF